MLNKHTGAQLLKNSGDPPVDIRFGNEQYIQCTAVTPEPDRTRAIFTNPDVPISVRTYYEHRYGWPDVLYTPSPKLIDFP
jgi:dedicator of cytokinesis protein 3